MDMAAYLVTAVLVEGRSAREVAAAHGVSKSWVYELLARYRQEGDAGLVPPSRRPRRSPTRVWDRFADEIVRLRKELVELGVDAGAETIRVHLTRRHPRTPVPSISTIWRVLKTNGFATPEPHKRPRSSYQRFNADPRAWEPRGLSGISGRAFLGTGSGVEAHAEQRLGRGHLGKCAELGEDGDEARQEVGARAAAPGVRLDSRAVTRSSSSST